MPDYRVGDVINGHVWTGTTWEPAPPPPPSNAPKPYKPPTPTSAWRTFGNLSIIFAVLLLLLGFGFLFAHQLNDLGRHLQADASASPKGVAMSIADFVRGLGVAFLGGSVYAWPALIAGILLGAAGILCLRKAPKAEPVTPAPLVEGSGPEA